MRWNEWGRRRIGRRRSGRSGRWRHDEARAQEPILGIAAADAAAEQIIVEGPGAQLSAALRKGPGGRGRPIDGLNNLDAIRRRQCARTADVGEHQRCRSSRRAAVDHQPVRWRVIRAEEGVHRDDAALADIAGRRQHRPGRRAGPHVDKPGVVQAGDCLVIAAQIQRSRRLHRVFGIRAEDIHPARRERAGRNRRGAAVRAVGGEYGRAAADLVDGACARDQPAEGQGVRAVEGQRAVVGHIADDRARGSAIAELQRPGRDRRASGPRDAPSPGRRSARKPKDQSAAGPGSSRSPPPATAPVTRRNVRLTSTSAVRFAQIAAMSGRRPVVKGCFEAVVNVSSAVMSTAC